MSKSSFDTAYWNQSPIYLGNFDNNVTGFEAWLTALKQQTEISLTSWLVVFENTGVYSKEFKRFLLAQGIACVEENPIKIKRNAPMKRGKSDPADAMMICEYAVEKLHKLSPDEPTSVTIMKIRPLLSRRNLLVKHKTSLKTSFTERARSMPVDVKKQLGQLHEELLAKVEEQIKILESLIKEYINQDEEVKQNYKLATSVIGVGLITGTLMICFTNNFSKEFNARKFACFSGVAPFPNESGIKKRKFKVSKRGSKLMKATISNCVTAAVQHDPFFRKYYNRLLEMNKPPGLIKNNIKNKLIARVFATVKRKEPYVKLAYQ